MTLLSRTRRTSPPVAVAAAVDPVPDDTRERAQDARQRAAQARRDADALLADARDQAARLVADAETRARALAAEAKTADGDADAMEAHLRLVNHAEVLRQRVADAEHQAAGLAAERDAVTARLADLSARLADLGGQHDTAAAALDVARDAGDVEQVTALRARLTAVDEVAVALRDQAAAARARLAALGDGQVVGELADAVRAVHAVQVELREVGNQLDPQRREAVTDRAAAEVEACLAANLLRIRDEQNPGHVRVYAASRR